MNIHKKSRVATAVLFLPRDKKKAINSLFTFVEPFIYLKLSILSSKSANLSHALFTLLSGKIDFRI